MPTDEEARAQLHRDQEQARVAHRRALERQLGGDQAARKRLQDAWQPVIDARQERESS